MKDLWFFLALLVGLMLVWYYMGGRSSPGATSGPTLEPPIGGKSSSMGSKKAGGKNVVNLSAPYSGRKSSADNEYLVLDALSSNSEKVNITGWKLEGKNGESVTIGQGTIFLQSYQQNFMENIYLAPGEKAYITTGTSPAGVSFKINICAGYLNQSLPFMPTLDRDCPNPAKEESFPSYVDNDCIDYLKNAGRCQTSFSSSRLTSNCRNFISEKFNYNSCINDYKNRGDFYQKTWRIFLGQGSQLWGDTSETITLKNSAGLLVDSVSY